MTTKTKTKPAATAAQKARATALLMPKVPSERKDLRKLVSDAAVTTYELEAKKAEREKAVEAVSKKFGGRITQLEKKLKGLCATLKTWALSHRPEFGGKQSLIVDGHTLKFREGTGKLVNPAGLKDDDMVERIVASDDEELVAATLSVKLTPDKNAIKALLDEGGALGERLAELGYEIRKEEAFSFEAGRVDSDAVGEKV